MTIGHGDNHKYCPGIIIIIIINVLNCDDTSAPVSLHQMKERCYEGPRVPVVILPVYGSGTPNIITLLYGGRLLPALVRSPEGQSGTL